LMYLNAQLKVQVFYNDEITMHIFKWRFFTT
jgi:hypothetical protein